MIFFSPSNVMRVYYSAPKANYTHHSPTHWYRWYYRYRSLCPDRQGSIEWWTSLTIPGFYDMVNISSTGGMCDQQLIRPLTRCTFILCVTMCMAEMVNPNLLPRAAMLHIY